MAPAHSWPTSATPWVHFLQLWRTQCVPTRGIWATYALTQCFICLSTKCASIQVLRAKISSLPAVQTSCCAEPCSCSCSVFIQSVPSPFCSYHCVVHNPYALICCRSGQTYLDNGALVKARIDSDAVVSAHWEGSVHTKTIAGISVQLNAKDLEAPPKFGFAVSASG